MKRKKTDGIRPEIPEIDPESVSEEFIEPNLDAQFKLVAKAAIRMRAAQRAYLASRSQKAAEVQNAAEDEFDALAAALKAREKELKPLLTVELP